MNDHLNKQIALLLKARGIVIRMDKFSLTLLWRNGDNAARVMEPIKQAPQQNCEELAKVRI